MGQRKQKPDHHDYTVLQGRPSKLPLFTQNDVMGIVWTQQALVPSAHERLKFSTERWEARPPQKYLLFRSTKAEEFVNITTLSSL
jgi:hypothetical protein